MGTKSELNEEQRIYPIIKSEEEVEQMFNNRVNKELNVERINHIKNEIKNLYNIYERYMCVKTSWGKTDSIVKIVVCFVAIIAGNGLVITIAVG